MKIVTVALICTLSVVAWNDPVKLGAAKNQPIQEGGKPELLGRTEQSKGPNGQTQPVGESHNLSGGEQERQSHPSKLGKEVTGDIPADAPPTAAHQQGTASKNPQEEIAQQMQTKPLLGDSRREEAEDLNDKASVDADKFLAKTGEANDNAEKAAPPKETAGAGDTKSVLVENLSTITTTGVDNDDDVTSSSTTFVPDDSFLYVPTAIFWDAKHPGHSLVRLCKLHFEAYHANPPVYPMVEDLQTASDCRHNGVDAIERTLVDLELEYVRRGCADSVEAGELEPACAPMGIVFHESRCGSTVCSNMLASLPQTIMYSELGPPNAVIRHGNLTFEERVHWLRVVYAAMARPIALHGLYRAGGPPQTRSTPPTPMQPPSTRPQKMESLPPDPPSDWSPRYLFLKTQHTTSLHLDVYQAAFPQMPWIYLHRDPVEVMMSLLRDNTAAPPPSAPPSMHINEEMLPYINNVPCMRSRADKDRGPPPFVVQLTGHEDGPTAVAQVPAEDWCAADLSWVISAAVQAAVVARREVLARALDVARARLFLKESTTDVTLEDIEALRGIDVSEGQHFAEALLKLVPDCVMVRDGMVLDSELEIGTLLGVGTSLFVDYTSIPHVVPLLIDSHLRPVAASVRSQTKHRCMSVIHRARAAGMTDSFSQAAISSTPWHPWWHSGRLLNDIVPDYDAKVLATQHVAPYTRVDRAHMFAITHVESGFPPVHHDVSNEKESSYADYNPLSIYTDVQGLELSELDEATMMLTSELYSKARATALQLASLAHVPGGIRPFQRTGGGRLRAARAWTSINTEGKFVTDVAAKQTMAWAALRVAAAKYLYPLRQVMTDFNIPFSEEEDAAMRAADAGTINFDRLNITASGEDEGDAQPQEGDAATESEHESIVQRHIVDVEPSLSSLLEPINYSPDRLQPGKGYPQLFPIKDIFRDWNPDIVTPPATYGRYSSLRTFDYQTELEEALFYRKAEVPFIVRNVPELEATVEKLSNDVYVTELMGEKRKYLVDVSDTQHFMFFNRQVADYLLALNGTDFIPPTTQRRMTFKQWLDKAYANADEVSGEEAEQLPVWWAELNHNIDEDITPITLSSLTQGEREMLHELRTIVAQQRYDATHADTEEKQASKEDTVATPPKQQQQKQQQQQQQQQAEAAAAAAPSKPTRASLRHKVNLPSRKLLSVDEEVEQKQDEGYADIISSPEQRKTQAFPSTLRTRDSKRTLPAHLPPSSSLWWQQRVLRWHPDVEHAFGIPSRRPTVQRLYRRRRHRYYLHVAGATKDGEDEGGLPWIPEHFPFLNAEREDNKQQNELFSVDANGFQGIHCRFGMPNIIAEAHYDSGRNFVAMARGYKRYILAPPDQCAFLGIMKDGASARHSNLDWTDSHHILNGTLGQGAAVDVVLQPGDVLYIPANWFHFIVSLTVNIQCNARSGTPPVGTEPLRTCDLPPSPVTEELGQFTFKEGVNEFVPGFNKPTLQENAAKPLSELGGWRPPRLLPPLEHARFLPVIDDIGASSEDQLSIEYKGDTLKLGSVKEVTVNVTKSNDLLASTFTPPPIDTLVPEDQRTPVSRMLDILGFEYTVLELHPVANSTGIVEDGVVLEEGEDELSEEEEEETTADSDPIDAQPSPEPAVPVVAAPPVEVAPPSPSNLPFIDAEMSAPKPAAPAVVKDTQPQQDTPAAPQANPQSGAGANPPAKGGVNVVQDEEATEVEEETSDTKQPASRPSHHEEDRDIKGVPSSRPPHHEEDTDIDGVEDVPDAPPAMPMPARPEHDKLRTRTESTTMNGHPTRMAPKTSAVPSGVGIPWVAGALFVFILLVLYRYGRCSSRTQQASAPTRQSVENAKRKDDSVQPEASPNGNSSNGTGSKLGAKAIVWEGEWGNNDENDGWDDWAVEQPAVHARKRAVGNDT